MLRRSLYALMGKEIKPEVIPTAKDKLEKFVPNKRVGSLTDKEKMDKEVSKMKSPQKIAEKRNFLYSGLTYLEDNEQEFHAMFALYRKIQDNKQIVIDALDKLESFKTYVQTENGYRVTAPEGYVLHHEGDMIKLVNRIEFSFINFTLDKSWK